MALGLCCSRWNWSGSGWKVGRGERPFDVSFLEANYAGSKQLRFAQYLAGAVGERRVDHDEMTIRRTRNVIGIVYTVRAQFLAYGPRRTRATLDKSDNNPSMSLQVRIDLPDGDCRQRHYHEHRSQGKSEPAIAARSVHRLDFTFASFYDLLVDETHAILHSPCGGVVCPKLRFAVDRTGRW